MVKIHECNIGDKVTMALKFQNLQIKKTTSNADYASIVGFDSIELINAKIWNLPQEKKDLLENGKIYICEGVIKDYQGKKQLNISDFREVLDGEVEYDDFFEYAPLNKNELQTKISGFINKIKNEKIKAIVLKTLKRYVNDYFEYPAAVTIHHNYISGLAYHTYSMLILSESYLKLYSYLNSDLVYAGIILHDIGKVKELSGSRGPNYTKEGNLLGHIAIGLSMINSVCEELGYSNTDEALALQHIILSHHGKLEYGSPKEPTIPEAALIFLLDYADSRLASLDKFISECQEGEYTEPVFAFEKRPFYKPKID